MADGLLATIEKGWAQIAATAGVWATYVCRDADGVYLVDDGEPATRETNVELWAILTDVSKAWVDAGAAEWHDRIAQVLVSKLPREPRPEDKLIVDGQTWTVKAVKISGGIGRCSIGRG